MQKTKLSTRIIAGAMLSLALVALGGEVVQAQLTTLRLINTRFTSLRRSKCVSSGPGRWSDRNIDVAIGRAVYKSFMNLNPSNGSATVTCRIRDDDETRPRYKTLELGLGMLDRDTASPATIINVYLDGRQSGTRTISPGEAASLSFDVTNVNNVAIEATCSSPVRYCSRVYVYKAELERIRDKK